MKSKSKNPNILWRNGWAYFRKVVTDPVTGVSQRKTVALGTQDKELALAKARQKRNDLKFGELDAMKSNRSKLPASVGELIETYKAKIHTVNESLEHNSVITNVSSLRSFLRWALGENGEKNVTVNVDELSLGVMDDLLVAKFKANYVRPAGEDRQAREARRRGAASLLRQAKSMFSKQALLIYRDLNVPDMNRFRAAATVETEDRVHLPIPAGTLQEMHVEINKVRASNPQLWLVHHLQKYLGLRNDEIAQARVEWFKRAPWGQVFFSVMRTPYFEPKRSEGHVPLTAEVAALFAPFVAGKQAADFLVEAPHFTAREDIVNIEHAAFMRRFLPAGEFAKAGYELRRWAAQVMEERYGHEAGRAFLRHVPQGVAERHYFERWYPWRRLGANVGVTLDDAKGVREDKAVDAWQEGAAALVALPSPAAAVKTPDA